jgi:prepilin-type N-terminal cleavage/methylation domain-containing protein
MFFMSRVSNFITHSVREGFTLIEVMIVVGLIMMFTTIGLEIDRQTKSQIEFLEIRLVLFTLSIKLVNIR